MITLGVCADTTAAPLVREAGFSFIELHVQNHLRPLAPEDEFEPILARIKASPLPAWAANCYIPGDLKITGPDVDFATLEKYVRTASVRAHQAGLKIIVFGSGGARCVPEDFARDRAWEQLVSFGKLAARHAEENGILVVVEPLNSRECNILTGTQESARYVRDVSHPSFRLLVDAYHWAVEKETACDITACGDLISHIHVATPDGRRAPASEPADFSVFFSALKDIQYSGGVSIECGFKDMAAELPPAHRELSHLIL